MIFIVKETVMSENKQKNLALGAITLTAFSFLSKFLGMWFRLYLTGRIGSEGMGLYQVIMSVYTLFATFATAGFSICVSRLAAERMDGTVSTRESVNALKKCMLLSSLIALFGMGILLSSASFIANGIMGDARIAAPIRVLAYSMVFIAPCACLKGYFLAEGKAWKNASSMIFEQLVKIGVSVFLFSFILTDSTDAGQLCLGIVWGTTVGEAASFLYCFIIYIFTTHAKRNHSSAAIKYRDIIRLIIPLAIGAYITTLLHTGESLLLPRCFELYGGDKASSLAEFGIIRGMTIPLLFFPFAFISSFVSLLIPRVTQYAADGKREMIRSTVERVISLSWVFSIMVSVVFFIFAKELSLLFYHTEECVSSLRILALINPMMYIETISVGILNGIGEQYFTLRCNVYNSILRIVAITTLIPRSGAFGYIILLVVSNVFTFALCYRKLGKATSFKLPFFRFIALPTVCSAVLGYFAHWLTSKHGNLTICIVGTCAVLLTSILYQRDLAFKRERIDDRT